MKQKKKPRSGSESPLSRVASKLQRTDSCERLKKAVSNPRGQLLSIFMELDDDACSCMNECDFCGDFYEKEQKKPQEKLRPTTCGAMKEQRCGNCEDFQAKQNRLLNVCPSQVSDLEQSCQQRQEQKIRQKQRPSTYCSSMDLRAKRASMKLCDCKATDDEAFNAKNQSSKLASSSMQSGYGSECNEMKNFVKKPCDCKKLPEMPKISYHGCEKANEEPKTSTNELKKAKRNECDPCTRFQKPHNLRSVSITSRETAKSCNADSSSQRAPRRRHDSCSEYSTKKQSSKSESNPASVEKCINCGTLGPNSCSPCLAVKICRKCLVKEKCRSASGIFRGIKT